MIPFEKLMKQSYPIYALQLCYATEKLLWYQLLGYTCDKYLYNFQEYIYGVPKFSNTTYRVLYQCPTCIQDKMSKNPHGHGTRRVSTQPYQVLLIYFFLLWYDL